VTALLALAVIGAGVVGALLRYGASLLVTPRTRFPLAVLLVNVVGSAIGGAVLALSERAAISDDLRLVLLTGFCGGLTTFSSFSTETIELVRRGRSGSALASVAANLALGVGAAALAWTLLR
jgi:CrcB protein